MEEILHTSATSVAVVVKHDSNIAGPATFDDALLALSRIAAELMLDLSSKEVITAAA